MALRILMRCSLLLLQAFYLPGLQSSRPSIVQAFNRPGLQSSKPSIVQAFYLGQNRSDLQDLGDCTQSSQIGPHLVQPLSARPIETTLTSRTDRRDMTLS